MDDLVPYQPPGAMAPLFAADHIRETMSALQNELIEVVPSPVIRRQPSKAERTRLHERKKQIHSLLQPAAMATEAQKRIGKAIGEMLGGWLNTRTGGDSGDFIIAGWTAKLCELPAWAVCLACSDFQEGRATFTEAGKERTLSPEYAPSQATVYRVAREKLDRLMAEAILIDRLMTAKLEAPPINPVEQARVGELLRDLADKMAATDNADRQRRIAEATGQRQEADERRRKFAADANARRLERYAELKLVPQYTADGKLHDADALPPDLRRTTVERERDEYFEER